MSIRSSKKYANEISIQEPIGMDKEGNEISLEDVIAVEKEPIIDQIDLKMNVQKLNTKISATLRGREKFVICMRYGLSNGDEKTQREIADLLDISRSYVSRIEKKALGKLNKAMLD